MHCVKLAALSQINAQAITLDAMDAGELGSIVGDTSGTLAMSVNSEAGTTSIGTNKVTSFVRKLDTLVATLELETFPSSVAAATESVLQAGPCGGEISGSVTLNESSGSFSATITFADYLDYDSDSFNSCSMGTGSLVNGTLSVNGSISQPADVSMNFRFNGFTMVGDGNDISLSGTAGIAALSSGQERISMNLVARDNNAGETFKLEKYVLLATSYAGYQTEEISGRSYHYEYGYVDVETLNPVETAFNSEWPRAGVVQFSGSAGSLVTLTFGTTSVTGTGRDSEGNAISFEYVYPAN